MNFPLFRLQFYLSFRFKVFHGFMLFVGKFRRFPRHFDNNLMGLMTEAIAFLVFSHPHCHIGSMAIKQKSRALLCIYLHGLYMLCVSHAYCCVYSQLISFLFFHADPFMIYRVFVFVLAHNTQHSRSSAC